jgi:hypothetical protein
VVVTKRGGRKLHGIVAQDQDASSRFVLVAYIDETRSRKPDRSWSFFESRDVRLSRSKKPVLEWTQEELEAKFGPIGTRRRQMPPDDPFYTRGFFVGGHFGPTPARRSAPVTYPKKEECTHPDDAPKDDGADAVYRVEPKAPDGKGGAS